MRALAMLPAVALLGTGCLTSGLYRTAHVVPEGEGDFAIGMSIVRATVDEPQSAGDATFTYPNVVPELSYHYGVAEDVEFGGRIALGVGMIELDTKYRFARSGSTHVAVQPAVGYRSLGFIEGFHGTLPLIVTQDLKPGVAFNASVFGTYTHFSATGDFDAEDLDFRGDTLNVGGAVGIEFTTPSGFHFMPALELQRSLSREGAARDLPHITAVIFGVTAGWGADERARKADRQLDRIEQKLDRAAPPPVEPAEPPPPPR